MLFEDVKLNVKQLYDSWLKEPGFRQASALSRATVYRIILAIKKGNPTLAANDAVNILERKKSKFLPVEFRVTQNQATK